VDEIKRLYPNAINITFFDSFNKNMNQYENIFLNNKGNMNHMNDFGNEIIYEKIKTILTDPTTKKR
jgi:hypothetical protein